MAEGRTKWPPVKDDWFVEPAAATEFLLLREHFSGGVWDPACGQGNIIRTCLNMGLPTSVGTDIVDRTGAAKWFLGTADFMDYEHRGLARRGNIICNPPYGRARLAEAFMRRAWSLTGIVKVAMFVNSKFLFSSRRSAGLFSEIPPHRVWPVLPRPSCPPGEFLLGGGKAEGGVENFVWLVWDKLYGAPGTQFLWNDGAQHDEAP